MLSIFAGVLPTRQKRKFITGTSLLCAAAAGVILITSPASAGFVAQQRVTTRIFYSETDVEGWDAVILGRVDSLGTRDIGADELHQSASDRSKITMILDNADGLLVGDELYVINENHLIVARLSLVSILQSVSFGHIGVGYGNFRRVQKNYLVVQRVSENNSRYAYIYKARGDFYKNSGDIAQAIIHYEKAIALNKNHPESHLSLGQIYYNKNMIDYAEKEFRIAYNARGYIYDNEDRYQMYKCLLSVCRNKVFEDDAVAPARKKAYIGEGLAFAKEARSLFKDDIHIIYNLGLFSFHSKEDVAAKNALLEVAAAEPENIDALLLLAQLYERHNNKDRAFEYVELALSVEPDSALAKDMYERLKR